MSPALILALAVGAAVVGAVAGGTIGVRAARSARSAQTEQQRVSQEEIAALQARVEAMAAALGSGRSSDYVITSLADDQAPDPGPDPVSVALSGREFTAVAVEESVVRIASLAHGVRRALAPRTRARIRFEMRQELKRTRRQRRLDLKAARRHLRTRSETADQRARDAA